MILTEEARGQILEIDHILENNIELVKEVLVVQKVVLQIEEEEIVN